jgi:hypothetical protein
VLPAAAPWQTSLFLWATAGIHNDFLLDLQSAAHHHQWYIIETRFKTRVHRYMPCLKLFLA